jgi:hypothetical protein
VPDSPTAPPPKPPATEKGIKYEVEVKTADEMGAGTDSNVYLSIHGDKSEAKKLQLSNSRGKLFEQGSLDKIDLELKDIGKVKPDITIIIMVRYKITNLQKIHLDQENHN